MSDSTPSPTIPNTYCDGPGLKKLIEAGLAWLEQNYEAINQLNVFPVPDGDTGTNMLLTLRYAYREIAANDFRKASEVADKIAYGAIMGSRGNSGTILSQLFRGFAQVISDKQSFDAELMSAGFQEAVKLAYRAVQEPKEGTILTVAREMAEEVQATAKTTTDLRTILERAVERGHTSVAQTPDLLPILKKAGVVDSGGQGLVVILEGMVRYLHGEVMIPVERAVAEMTNLADTLRSPDQRGYGYDVQFILHGKNLDPEAVRSAINAMGDSGVIVGDPSTVKVHIHVHDPGIPISYGANLGVITDVVVENMEEQSKAYIAGRAGSNVQEDDPVVVVNEGDIAVVAVAPGDGLRRVLHELGVASVVSGGQTMNPSTEDFLNAIGGINTDKFILLPNNRNIILTAEQAAKLATDKQVAVIPTRTIPQGITSMLSFAPGGDLAEVVQMMKEAIADVTTGEVTTATRSVELDGVSVETGQIIGLIDGNLSVAGSDVPTVVRQVLEKMNAHDHEVITIYYGDLIREADADALVDTLRKIYPDQEFDLIMGGQPYYHYILSAE